MNQVYDNFVLENKYESVLDTELDLQNYVTVDTSLAENPGVTKKVNVRTVIGDVQEVAMTEGNTENIEVALSQKDYTVGTTQGRFVYYDEEYMTDPMVLDTGLRGLAEKMVNNFTSKAVAEWTSIDVTQFVQIDGTGITFDNIVDAIAILGDEREEGYFLLVNPSEKAGIRKNLKDTLQYVEAFARTGYIGSVAGVPVIVTKAVPAGIGILADKSAVTLFIKKGAEMEQQRDANIRKNEVYARKVTLVALTDATRVVLIGNKSELTISIPLNQGQYNRIGTTKIQANLSGPTTGLVNWNLQLNGKIVRSGKQEKLSGVNTFSPSFDIGRQLIATDEITFVANYDNNLPVFVTENPASQLT